MIRSPTFRLLAQPTPRQHFPTRHTTTKHILLTEPASILRSSRQLAIKSSTTVYSAARMANEIRVPAEGSHKASSPQPKRGTPQKRDPSKYDSATSNNNISPATIASSSPPSSSAKRRKTVDSSSSSRSNGGKGTDHPSPFVLTHTKSEREMAIANDDSAYVEDPMITASMKAAQEEAEQAVAAARAQEDEASLQGGLVVPVLLRSAGVTAQEAPATDAEEGDNEDSATPADTTGTADASSSNISSAPSTLEMTNDATTRSGLRRTAQLETLLQKASHFNNFILGKLEHGGKAAASATSAADEKQKKKTAAAAASAKKGKRGKGSTKEEADATAQVAQNREEALEDAARKMAEGKGEEGVMEQPASLQNGVLKGYQLEGLYWLSSLWMNGLNGILADEMGLGKTIQVIALFALLREKGVNGPFLVVAPLATLPNWVLEVRKWLPSASVCLYHGTAAEREVLREEQMPVGRERETSKLFPIVVTSYEMASIDRKHLMRYQWRWLVVDEGQRIKNRNGRLFHELKEIPSESRLLLSGTPIQNSLEELWTLLNFCQPDIFDNLGVFRSWFGFQNIGKDTTVDDIIDEEHRERVVSKLHEVLRPFLLRRMKRDVKIDLPEKKELVVYAHMSEIQHDYYRLGQAGQLREALMQQGVPDADKIRQTNPQMLQRKICNHPFLVAEPITRDGTPIGEANPKILIEACGKLKLLDRMMRKLYAQGHRVLLFSQMTEMLTLLEDYLHYRRWKYCRIDGSVKIDERQEQIEAFNKDRSIFCFLLSTRAGGLGINLAGADTVIIYDSDWNPHRDAQAQDRAHRIGQTRDVAVYRLLTVGSVEIEMMEAQISKKKLERLSITGGDFRKAGRRSRGEMTTENLRRLLADDVKDIQRRHGGEEGAGEGGGEGDMKEEELDQILDRKRMFEEGGLSVEGRMYDLVVIGGSDLLSGISQGGRE